VKRLIVTAVIAAGVLTPAVASARTTCGNLPKIDVYGIAGPSCTTAKAVAKVTSSALLAGKLYRKTSYVVTVNGRAVASDLELPE
jgi:TRAP-type uncharacterized transport system substrate-binding protein